MQLNQDSIPSGSAEGCGQNSRISTRSPVHLPGALSGRASGQTQIVICRLPVRLKGFGRTQVLKDGDADH